MIRSGHGAPKLGTKPFFAFIEEHFESVEELKHLKEMLIDHFKGEVCILICMAAFVCRKEIIS
jgi:hypothetical protein